MMQKNVLGYKEFMICVDSGLISILMIAYFMSISASGAVVRPSCGLLSRRWRYQRRGLRTRSPQCIAVPQDDDEESVTTVSFRSGLSTTTLNELEEHTAMSTGEYPRRDTK